jgi:hypothetical protein
MSTAEKIEDSSFDPIPLQSTERWLSWFLGAAVVFFLFYQLGGAALYEPDEGRNAEKAREILVLNDWITPHENFHAVLDKPIFYYWLVALSYKLFGVSEWSARLPSALAAMACAWLVYCFARARWGRWEALWAVLILLTSTEFFLMGRIVIFDMTLTFCQTLALTSFYEAAHADSVARRRIFCAMMYLALATGTLIKGLIGVMIPGMVIFFYMLLGKRWEILRRIYLIPGVLLFFAVVLPWYLQADARNPGYLSYYIWQEHFGRYATVDFDRSEPWYYFIFVGLIGFFPWTFLLPILAKDHWKKTLNDKTLFLVLWLVLPFLFFSVSKSKLPHYILPIFPALAILTAVTLVRLYQQSESKLRFALALGWLMQILNTLYLSAGTIFPSILPSQLRAGVNDMAYFIWFYALFSVLMLCYMIISRAHGTERQRMLFLVHGLSMCVFLIFLARMMIVIAPTRSAQALAKQARTQLTAATQVVFYDTYLAGMAFYLQTERPIWFVTYANKKRTFLGNYFAMSKRTAPLTPWGKAVLDFAEFGARWRTATQPLLVILKEKNLPRMAQEVGQMPKRVAGVDEYAVVLKQ